MESNSPENHDDSHENDPINSTPDEDHDAIQNRLANLSLYRADSNKGENPDSNEPNIKKKQQQAHVELDTSEEGGSTRTYTINTLPQDKDSGEPEEEEEDQETRNIRPDELLGIIFNFDTPREIDLNVKIKGDFNVTILYAPQTAFG
ncbi:hypothetical protein BDW59DRAFT_146342 [Aspergillus cavernicola]|uniref:PITH domain-containing protein n=1 Tax=Aspergillus cavernicola TaxID=176166 RepID=A0ABR4IEE2_9EURO